MQKEKEQLFGADEIALFIRRGIREEEPGRRQMGELRKSPI